MLSCASTINIFPAVALDWHWLWPAYSLRLCAPDAPKSAVTNGPRNIICYWIPSFSNQPTEDQSQRVEWK